MKQKVFAHKPLTILIIAAALFRSFGASAAPSADGINLNSEISNVLLAENFESGIPAENILTGSWNGWDAITSNHISYDNDHEYTISEDPDEEGNKVARFYRTKALLDGTVDAYNQDRDPDERLKYSSLCQLSKNLPEVLNSGMVSTKFRVRADGLYSDTFQIVFVDSTGRGMEVFLSFLDSRISGNIKSSFGFGPNPVGSDAPKGEWFDVEFILNLNGITGGDFEEGDPRLGKRALYTVVVNDELLVSDVEALWYTNGNQYFNNGSLKGFRIGTNRQTAANRGMLASGIDDFPTAQFYVDDIVLKELSENEIACMEKANELSALFENELDSDVLLPVSDGEMSISWRSDAQSIITDNGHINQIWGKTGKTKITATISKGNALIERSYNVTLSPALAPYSISRLVWDAAADNLARGVVVSKNILSASDDVIILAAVYDISGGQNNLTDIRIIDADKVIPGIPASFSSPMTIAEGNVYNAFVWDRVSLAPVSAVYEFGKSLYYVSPEGNDGNPGTFLQPWKTMKKAAKTLKPGETAIFEDGIYYEDNVTTFSNSGEEGAHITVRARNKHQAEIVYPETVMLTSKFRIAAGQQYIDVQNLSFTQVKAAEPTQSNPNPTSDILLTCLGKHCSIVGNKFYNVYEEGIKVTAAHDILVDGNLVIGSAHEGIDVFNTSSSIVRSNEVIDCGRVGIMVKGGSRNVIVYNNFVHNETKSMNTAAFTIGGVSNSTDPPDVARDTGFEAYNCIFYNNIVYSGSQGMISSGYDYYGAKDCRSYNNITVGTSYGFRFRNPSGEYYGWGWDPPNARPVIKNNIIMNCGIAYLFVDAPLEGIDSDYNIFYNTNTENVPSEPHSKFSTNPLFEDYTSDWRLRTASPAIGAGVPMPTVFDGFEGYDAWEGYVENRKIYIDPVDYAGLPRTTPWDIGAYAYNP